MDTLKQKLNDIGSCIGYPFYFFEDGSYSKAIVNGKMNAIMVVKKPFADVSGDCFLAGTEANKVAQETDVFVQTTIDNKEIQVLQSKEEEERAKKIREISFQVASGECVSDEDFAFLIQFGDVKMVKKFIDNCWKKLYWHDGAFAGYTTDIIGAYSLSLEALIVAGYTDIFVDFFGNARNCFVCWGSKLIIPLYKKGKPELIKYVWDSSEISSCGDVLVYRGDRALYQAYRKYRQGKYSFDEVEALLDLDSTDMLAIFLKSVSRDDVKVLNAVVKDGSFQMVKTLLQCWGLSDILRDLLMYAERKELRSIVGAA